MDKITVTEAARAFFDLGNTNRMSTSQLPSININQQLATHLGENKTFAKHGASKSKLDFAALRSILKDNTLSELSKLKEQT